MAEAGLLGRAALGAEGSPSTPRGSSPAIAVNPLLPKAPPLPAKAKRVATLQTVTVNRRVSAPFRETIFPLPRTILHPVLRVVQHVIGYRANPE
jgi:hypothetical protein